MSSTDGSTLNTFVYDSFGNTAANESIGNPYRYTGREWDRETGLHYYRARYYDPSTGRFISEDPLGFDGGVNSYNYVGGNPLLFSDPLGLAKVGDLVFFNFHGGSSNIPEHVAVVTAVDALGYPTKAFGALQDSMTFHEVDLSTYGNEYTNGQGIRPWMIGTADVSGLTSKSLSELILAWRNTQVAPNWDGTRGNVCVDLVNSQNGYGGQRLRDAILKDFEKNAAKYRSRHAGTPNPNDSNVYRRNVWLQQFLMDTGRYSTYR